MLSTDARIPANTLSLPQIARFNDSDACSDDSEEGDEDHGTIHGLRGSMDDGVLIVDPCPWGSTGRANTYEVYAAPPPALPGMHLADASAAGLAWLSSHGRDAPEGTMGD